jgi:hypothetical protein
MRKVINATTLAGLILVALAAPARAQDSGYAAPPESFYPRLQFGASFLPMAVGKFTSTPGGMTTTADAAFAYGVAVSGNYMVLPGLSVGLAPQVVLNVKAKDDPGDAAKEVDLMARLAYTFPVVDTISLYAEVLPGYSLIIPQDGDTAAGLVLAFGVGGIMDLSRLAFVSMGGGYQVGFQKLPAMDMNAEVRTKYVRVALGGGVRF